MGIESGQGGSERPDKWAGYVPSPLQRRLDHQVPRVIARALGKQVDKSGGTKACWPWTGTCDRDGYGRVDGVRQGRAHRLAWEHHNGRRLAAGEQVLHSCDNPSCCNPRHLRAGTAAENVADRVKRDRSAKGSRNGRARLTEAQVLLIYADEATAADIAARYGVTEAAVHDIRSGRNWGWLTSGG